MSHDGGHTALDNWQLDRDHLVKRPGPEWGRIFDCELIDEFRDVKTRRKFKNSSVRLLFSRLVSAFLLSYFSSRFCK